MTTTRQHAQSNTGTRQIAWVVLAAAVLQVVAPVVSFVASGSTPGADSGPELLIAPVGWAFAIWGVIYSLALAQAIASLVRGGRSVPRRLQIGQIALYLGGTAWIVMSSTGSSLATAAALLVMLIAAVDAVLTVARDTIEPRWLSVLSRASVGLYAGWVTAAFFINLSTALVDLGPVEADQLAWQLVVLVVAALTLLALTAWTRGILAYAAAGTWALVGIAVTGSENGTTEVVIAAIVAAVALLGTGMVLRLRQLHPA